MRQQNLEGLLNAIGNELQSIQDYCIKKEVFYKYDSATFSVTTVFGTEGDNVTEPKFEWIAHRTIEDLEIYEGEDLAELTEDQQTLINEYLESWTV